MKPLIVLLTVFLLSSIVTYFGMNHIMLQLSGRVAISVMILFTAMAHFKFTKGLVMMIPELIPLRKAIVFLTGVLEIVAAICILFSHLQKIAGWFLVIFFVIMLPANIYAAIKKVNYEKGTLDGKGIKYLWFRIPLQILFIIWTYYSSIDPTI